MSLGARPLLEADLAAALGLANTYDRRWFGESLLEPEDLRTAWSEPGFSLVDDSEAWVDADGTLLAFATLDERGGIELAVDPAWAGSGLAEALVGRWEGEARRRGLPSVHRYLAGDDAPGAAALRERGYVLHHTGWILTLAPDAAVAERVLPAGYAVRPAVEADATSVHTVVDRAFAEWGSASRAYASWRSGLWDRPDLTPDHCRVATYDGVVVGACLALDPGAGPGRDEVWVPQLAVDREHRHHGLAAQLLASVCLAARARGTASLGLGTDTRSGALGLYERLGFTVRHTVHNYVLDLAAPA